MFDKEDVKEILRLVSCSMAESTDTRETARLLRKIKEIFKDDVEIREDVEELLHYGGWGND